MVSMKLKPSHIDPVSFPPQIVSPTSCHNHSFYLSTHHYYAQIGDHSTLLGLVSGQC